MSRYLVIFSIFLAVSAKAQISIKSAKAYDTGDPSSSSVSTSSIDVVQDECDTADSPDPLPEDFNNTILVLNVQNSGSKLIRIRRFSYYIRDAFGDGESFRSRALSPIASGEIAADGNTDITVFFLKAEDGGKYYTGSSTAIPSTLGFKNITFRLRGITSSGERVSATFRSALSFQNVARCS